MASSGLFCSTCGQMNNADAEFCSKCGAPQKRIEPAAPWVAQPSATPPAGYGQQTGVPGYQPAYAPPAAGFRGYGGFWVRALAFIIDMIVVGIVTFPVKILVFGITALGQRSAAMAHGDFSAMPMLLGGAMIVGAFRTFVSWLYWAAMESSPYQATLGKMALGLKVTDLAGARISFPRATGRYFAKIISAMILFVGFIMVGFTERKQGLHDMIAGTLVLKK